MLITAEGQHCLHICEKPESDLLLAWVKFMCICCRRMLDTFVEVVRRGMQEGVDEVTVTYNAPVAPRPGAEPQDDRGDSEDLPDLLPINDGVHPSRCGHSTPIYSRPQSVHA